MTIPFKPIAIAVVLSLTLPGCSSLFKSGKFASRANDEKAAQRVDARTRQASVLTDMGRHALDQGNTGLAIEAFQRAAVSGEAPAPAFNGLGVAFARIGRFDLAQRYFEQAATLDPSEQRYQTNLARLMRSPLFAQRHDADRAAEMLAQTERDQAAEAKARQAAGPGRLQRVAANQFFIQTVTPAKQTGPARMAMVISRNKSNPVLEPRSVEAAFDASIGKGKSTPDAAASNKPTSRTIQFKPVVVARP
ncbi:MAG: hypothetical protein KGM49_14745 [Sphingomonadales bacterium]|nr:hypothetical protein [Sphingomonadales bacterium]